MAFIDLMKEKARQDKQTIVLPESKDKRTLIAAAQILEEGTADLIMIGKEEKILDGAGWLEVDLTGIKVVDPDLDPNFAHYAETLFELRKHKGMTLEKAEEILREDYITYGVMMVKEKIADGLVAGACHATADTLRPALQILKTAPGTELVSGFFIMDVPDCEFGNNGTFLFADCGLNQRKSWLPSLTPAPRATALWWERSRLSPCFPTPQKEAHIILWLIRLSRPPKLPMRNIHSLISTVNYSLMPLSFRKLLNPKRKTAKLQVMQTF